MKKINVGTSDFKEIIDNNYYFIDKTLIIKEFLDDTAKIILIPRPRRFGKTLNMSIIKYFLEKSNENRRYLFDGLNIEKESQIMSIQGKYPLIYITFKDDKHSNFDNFIEIFRFKISDLYSSFKFLLDILDNTQSKYFNNMLNRTGSISELEISLLKLSEFLNKYYNQKVIILIDEYDTPIHHSHFEGYYDEMIGFTRNFLSSALKDNIHLEKAMLTGILRVAKESIFSGLNNLKVYTLLQQEYSNMFGFTENEIENLLKYFDSTNETDNFKKWYNGYLFGGITIYNPWSVLYYLSQKEKVFMPYWVNTSENRIIKEILAEGSGEIKQGLETLYKGGHVITHINEDVVMKDIKNGKENIWSFLLMSGYLKPISKELDLRRFKYKLAIPNEEIMCLYEDIIDKWFVEAEGNSDYDNMIKALVIGDIKNFTKIFKRYALESFSYFDVSGKTPEKVYHAFVLGMLVSLSNTHEVLSNRESGIGRYDVSLIPKDKDKLGYIFEFKRYDEEDEETIEETLSDALNQIEVKKYDTELISRGIKNIVKMAIVFNGKNVHIKTHI
ncbi:MAG: AAA family ATPase [Romboutsia sp.]|uniref:AAA family ATPase n=1 Tax=Romboutsia sp. TaxID=1965302 RepID=UPI003F39EFFF